MHLEAAVTMPESTRRTVVDGTVVELWENPDAVFGCDARALSDYAADGEWDLLFNGIMLNVDRGPRSSQGIFKSPLAQHPV